MEFDRFHMKNGLEAILIFSYYSFFFFGWMDSSQSRLNIFQTKPKKSMYVLLLHTFCMFFLKYLEN